MKSIATPNEFTTPKHTEIAVQQPSAEKTRTVERNDNHHKQGHPRAVHTPVDPWNNGKILKNKLAITSQSIENYHKLRKQKLDRRQQQKATKQDWKA